MWTRQVLAKDRPDVLARIHHIKQYLRYNHLRWLMTNEEQEGTEILTLAL
jgi:hypothetical protein